MKLLTRRRSTTDDGSTSVEAARVRGGSLAVVTAAAAIHRSVVEADPCADTDADCLRTRQATLLRHRELVRRASAELTRLEGVVAERMAARASDVAAMLPDVRFSRETVDTAHDTLVQALESVRQSLTGVAGSVRDRPADA